MIEPSNDELKEAVESQHGGTATFLQSVPVHDTFEGKTLWNGDVAVFKLKHSPTGAFRAYAWSYDLPDGKQRLFAVLHGGAVKNPREAVRTAILAEARASS